MYSSIIKQQRIKVSILNLLLIIGKVSDIGIPPEPEPEPEPIPPTPIVNETPSRIVTVSGQKYEVKVVNGKRVMEPINAPVPPIRLRKKYIQVSSQKEVEKKVMEQEVKEEVVTQPVEVKASDQPVEVKASDQPVEEVVTQDVKEKTMKPVEEDAVQPVEEDAVQPVEEASIQPVKEVVTQDVEEVAIQPVEKKKEEISHSIEVKKVESVKESQSVSNPPSLPPSLPVSQHRMKRDRNSSNISSMKEKRQCVSIQRESLYFID